MRISKNATVYLPPPNEQWVTTKKLLSYFWSNSTNEIPKVKQGEDIKKIPPEILPSPQIIIPWIQGITRRIWSLWNTECDHRNTKFQIQLKSSLDNTDHHNTGLTEEKMLSYASINIIYLSVCSPIQAQVSGAYSVSLSLWWLSRFLFMTGFHQYDYTICSRK